MCVCVGVCARARAHIGCKCTRWPVLYFWPVSLGKAAWSLRRPSTMRGLGKILKEIHAHTQTHDSNRELQLQREALPRCSWAPVPKTRLCFVCVQVTSCSVTQVTQATFYLGWCLRSGLLYWCWSGSSCTGNWLRKYSREVERTWRKQCKRRGE